MPSVPGVRPFTLLNGNILTMMFLLTYGHLRHSHMWIAFTGIAGRILQSPAHHQLHHSANPAHFDKNLGFALALWDWAFGTLAIPAKTREPIVFGVGDEGAPFRSTLSALTAPCGRAAGHVLRRGPKDRRRARRRPLRPDAALTAGSPPYRILLFSYRPHRSGDISVPGEKSARRRGVLLVLVATLLWSLAGLFARLLVHLDVWTVMGWRALLGAASIAAVGLFEWRNGRLDNPLGFGALSPLVALLAMIAISAYTASVMTTTIADVMVIYATMPFVAAAMGFLVNGERVSARTLVASSLALVGIIVMVASGLGSGRLLGQALSMLMTLAFAGMIVLQRRQPGASVIVVNCLGAIGSGIFGLANSPLQPISLHDFAILFVFGLTTIGLAFVLFMEGAKFIPSAEAGLISLLDVVLGPLWVFIAFGENPGLATMFGGAIVLAPLCGGWRRS